MKHTKAPTGSEARKAMRSFALQWKNARKYKGFSTHARYCLRAAIDNRERSYSE